MIKLKIELAYKLFTLFGLALKEPFPSNVEQLIDAVDELIDVFRGDI